MGWRKDVSCGDVSGEKSVEIAVDLQSIIGVDFSPSDTLVAEVRRSSKLSHSSLLSVRSLRTSISTARAFCNAQVSAALLSALDFVQVVDRDTGTLADPDR